jgi:hypothetical protein
VTFYDEDDSQLVFVQLKETYHTVTILKNLSGLPWDDEDGLNITAETEETFQTYVMVCFDTHHPISALISS